MEIEGKFSVDDSGDCAQMRGGSPKAFACEAVRHHALRNKVVVMSDLACRDAFIRTEVTVEDGTTDGRHVRRVAGSAEMPQLVEQLYLEFVGRAHRVI